MSQRAKCSAKACRRSIKLEALDNEWPTADAWARVDSVANSMLYLCPLHRLELEEFGEVTKGNRRMMTEAT